MANHEQHVFAEARLPFILHRDFSPPTDYRGSNWHDNIELILITAGEGFVLCDGQEIPLQEGEVFTVNSEALHAFRSREEGCAFRYDCLIIDHSFFAENGLAADKMSFTSLLRDVAMADAMRQVRIAWESADELRIARVRCAVLSLVCHLCAHHLAPAADSRPHQDATPHVKRAIRYMEAHFAEPISLCSVAQALSLSRYHLAHLFRHATGHSVVSYLKMLRCRHAREMLLQTELSTAQIAQACGFSTQPYFARCFSQVYGMPPSQARKGKRTATS